MLRINLLPAYVAQRRLTWKLFWSLTFLFILILVVFLSWGLYLIPQRAALEAEAQTDENNRNEIQQIQQEADNVKASVAPIQAKLDFVKACHNYADAWVTLYDHMARYSYQANPKIIYSSADVSGTTMSISAYSPSIADIGRYLQTLYNDRGFQSDFTSVAIDHLPGYPDALVDKYYLDGKLVSIGAPPASSSTSGMSQGAGSASAASGPPGGFGGPPAGIIINHMGNGGGGAFGGGASSQALGGFEAVTPIEDIIAPQINPLASPAQQERQRLRILSKIKVKHEARGFAVQITCTLKNPLTPPVPPTIGQGS